MKRTAFAFVIMMALAGCTQTEPVADQSANNVAAQTPQQRLAEASTDREFAEGLAAVTGQAQQLETELAFGQAVGVWKSIDAALSQKYGPESWQAANARLSAIIAEMQMGFVGEQRHDSLRVQELQRQLSEAVKNGDRQAAIKLADSSIQLTEGLFGENSPLVGKQLLQLGTLYSQAGQPDRAISSLHRANEILKTTFHSKHPDIERVHSELGMIYLAKGSFGPAISNLKTATSLAAELWGEDSLNYALEANELAVAYQQTGQPGTALKIHQAAELIRMRKLGLDHALVAYSRLNAGIACIDLKDYELARKYLMQAIDGFQSQNQIEAHLLDRARGKLATVHMLTGLPNLAEPLLEEMLRSQVAQFGTDHAEIAELQYRLGIALAKQGKYDRAEPMLRQALSNATASPEAGRSENDAVHEGDGVTSPAYAARRRGPAVSSGDRTRRSKIRYERFHTVIC